MKMMRVVYMVLSGWLVLPASVSAFYNPSTGRWLSRDRIDEFGGLNIYGAVQNDSVNRVDPRGNMIWNPPRVVASCLPCICRDVKITFDPGGAKFEWGITSNPYDSKALKKLGNNIKVEWKVLGSCKNCKYSQDETAAVMATGFSRDDPTDAINNTFGGLVGTEHDAGGLDTETCSYMDRMGQDLDDLGYWPCLDLVDKGGMIV